ncbi:serine hydrolase [Nocardiopsis listeri]|uniref:serine hydrolase n=1 Tax=Nocardiopsis listeri TaxID=53440 RepID=UPI000829A74C|nr:serine hydrolase [Nocardiopsis listeri]
MPTNRTPVALTATCALGLTLLVPTNAAADIQNPVCASDTHPEVAERLSEEIRERVEARDGRVSVGVSAHDGDLRCGLDPTAEFDAASVGKVVVLGALLRLTMDEDRELTDSEDDLATDMITVSGNDSAVELRDRLGAERIQDFLDLAGMDDTVLHPDGFVGLMKITADDQLTLLELLRTDNDVLGAGQRDYARGLMGDVIDEQRWGVPTGAPADATVYLKNGWLPYPDTDTWRINSIGGFQDTPIGDYDLVVLTDGTADAPGMQYGVETIESVAVGVHTVLTGGSVRTPLTRLSDSEQVSDGSDRS